MTVLAKPRPDVDALFVSASQMDEIRAIVARQFEEFGTEYSPDITSQELRRAMAAAGIRPEENFLSRAIIEAREEQECEHSTRGKPRWLLRSCTHSLCPQ